MLNTITRALRAEYLALTQNFRNPCQTFMACHIVQGDRPIDARRRYVVDCFRPLDGIPIRDLNLTDGNFQKANNICDAINLPFSRTIVGRSRVWLSQSSTYEGGLSNGSGADDGNVYVLHDLGSRVVGSRL
jgi:hypothetical protein